MVIKQFAFAVTITAWPLPDMEVGDTAHPDRVKVVVVVSWSKLLPKVRVIDSVTEPLPPVTVRENVPEFELWSVSPG